MEGFDPATVFSSIDRQGDMPTASSRPWRMEPARLAEALLPVLDARDIDVVERVEQVVYGFAVRFDRHWTGQLRAKLGLAAEEPDDRALGGRLPAAAAAGKGGLHAGVPPPVRRHHGPDAALHDLFGRERPALSDWLARWRQRMAPGGKDLAGLRRNGVVGQSFVIPRNHCSGGGAVECRGQADLGPFERLLAKVLGGRTNDGGSARPFTLPASPEVAAAHRTFCGT